MMDWTVPYVGIPWQFHGRSVRGLDCWGLVWMVYRDVKGIVLPSFAGATADEAEVSAIIGAKRSQAPWRQVEIASEFDVLVFRRGRAASHVGIAVTAERFLHVHDNKADSHIARFDTGRWAVKLDSIYRHEALV